ncbi:DHH family phosphoesterase [Patescibacteria group bacterium]|nr:DHH family phosphoesterase [Patescibacteria group bacterium]MBU1868599.1 DHH family phosphoesterase [Patescibacteria group bacterium]
MQEKFPKVQEIIDSSKSILIPFHVHPDGDMVGSGLAMAAYLKSAGKKVRVVSVDPVNPEWKFLPYFDLIENIDPLELNLASIDLIIFIDSESSKRVTRGAGFSIPDEIKTIGVDHHKTNPQEFQINILNYEEVSSAAQLILEYFTVVDFPLNKEIALLLYWGLIMDTGLFEYFAPSPLAKIKAHEDAATLLTAGAPHDQLVHRIRGNQNLETIKFLAKGLSNLQIDKEYRFCWTVFSNLEIDELGLGGKVSMVRFSIKPFLNCLKGTDFGILLTEDENNFISVSLRARRQDGVDVSELARILGGGGHRAAAGIKLKMSLEEAEKLVLEMARKFARKELKTE